LQLIKIKQKPCQQQQIASTALPIHCSNKLTHFRICNLTQLHGKCRKTTSEKKRNIYKKKTYTKPKTNLAVKSTSAKQQQTSQSNPANQQTSKATKQTQHFSATV